MGEEGARDDSSSAYEALLLAGLSEFGMILFAASPSLIIAYARCGLSSVLPYCHLSAPPAVRFWAEGLRWALVGCGLGG